MKPMAFQVWDQILSVQPINLVMPSFPLQPYLSASSLCPWATADEMRELNEASRLLFYLPEEEDLEDREVTESLRHLLIVCDPWCPRITL